MDHFGSPSSDPLSDGSWRGGCKQAFGEHSKFWHGGGCWLKIRELIFSRLLGIRLLGGSVSM